LNCFLGHREEDDCQKKAKGWLSSALSPSSAFAEVNRSGNLREENNYMLED